jgi:hypothetical protein
MGIYHLISSVAGIDELNRLYLPRAISTIDRPRDHTSALTVYDVNASSILDPDGEDPLILSGYGTYDK